MCRRIGEYISLELFYFVSLTSCSLIPCRRKCWCITPSTSTVISGRTCRGFRVIVYWGFEHLCFAKKGCLTFETEYNSGCSCLNGKGLLILSHLFCLREEKKLFIIVLTLAFYWENTGDQINGWNSLSSSNLSDVTWDLIVPFLVNISSHAFCTCKPVLELKRGLLGRITLPDRCQRNEIFWKNVLW